MTSTAKLYEVFTNSSGICTDTRSIKADCIYWALIGANFNGNTFVDSALASGAKYAVVSDSDLADNNKIFYVKDSLKALQELANYHRRQFEIPILAITGSNGKTTTKELVASVLSRKYRTHVTKGNLNNHIGVPLTLLEMKMDTEIAVIEMGANHQGEINDLCLIAEPTCGLITNIGKAHLEGFGGIEGVKKGKSELYRFLDGNRSLIFVNWEEPELRELASRYSRLILYGLSENAQDNENFNYSYSVEKSEPFLDISFYSPDHGLFEAQSNLIGRYNIANITSAMSVGLYFKVPELEICKAIESYFPNNNRSEVRNYGELKVVMDAYNANPTSMEHALKNFAMMTGHPKRVILGDMFELGESSFSEHQTIINMCLNLGFDEVILVGNFFHEAAKDHKEIKSFPDLISCQEYLSSQPKGKGLLLLKASRGMKLESLLDQLVGG